MTIAIHTLVVLLAFITGWKAEHMPDPDIAAVREWEDMAERHPWYFAQSPPVSQGAKAISPASSAPVSYTVEQWRPLISVYFNPGDVDWALAIIQCESSGNPNAVGPTNDHGLFQHLGQYWQDRSSRAGWAGANIYNPEANIAVAAWLLRTGGRGHWVCKA